MENTIKIASIDTTSFSVEGDEVVLNNIQFSPYGYRIFSNKEMTGIMVFFLTKDGKYIYRGKVNDKGKWEYRVFVNGKITVKEILFFDSKYWDLEIVDEIVFMKKI